MSAASINEHGQVMLLLITAPSLRLVAFDVKDSHL
jgi:hypothetical protein